MIIQLYLQRRNTESGVIPSESVTSVSIYKTHLFL